MPVSEESREGLLGYVTSVREGGGYRGGLLVVDLDGDPVDFAATEPLAVRGPWKRLYGDRLASTLVAKIFARPLLEAIEAEPDVLCFDEPSLLARTVVLPCALAVLAPAGAPNGGAWVRTSIGRPGKGLAWFGEAGEERLVEGLLGAAARRFAPVALEEPFDRLRLALRDLVEGESDEADDKLWGDAS